MDVVVDEKDDGCETYRVHGAWRAWRTVFGGVVVYQKRFERLLFCIFYLFFFCSFNGFVILVLGYGLVWCRGKVSHEDTDNEETVKIFAKLQWQAGSWVWAFYWVWDLGDLGFGGFGIRRNWDMEELIWVELALEWNRMVGDTLAWC